ncbi:3-carboxy-cis,cis-muconate cycloisomerase [Verticillium alfalfae VaMs.102]|uniref:3-carboxy-cis,cis-muconate cycloisomerase n=1 Tax=Verticillium alfalfae (strain VaMs.102 / ATCC MYA-4576 / FGSC 10136) TaxID=526221 RepID=C9SU57_VERA1|nr:3-carboxy-cis,cis-muconate cycloisomerase [Verticillium alfalfae VaMs.102]EEY22368.1 3-carboxy-cis,cis-muconate cycloisomerase [Verticillium alfalfae VaMs.102]
MNALQRVTRQMARVSARSMPSMNQPPRRLLGSVSALDSVLYRSMFGTDEARKIFSDEAYIKSCVDVETALARAQAKCNVIPQTAAEAITSTADASKLNYDRLANETEIVGYPILPLIRQLSDQCGEAGKYLHWGATTQDIMDTASMLQMKAGLDLVEAKLRSAIKALTILAEEYRDAPMAGRTHLQHALPVTFGYKCASWLSGLQRHLERIQQLRPRCLLVQYGGAAGTLASLGGGDEGIEVRKQLAEDLGLHDPSMTWHVARDGVAEIINTLALIGGSLGKVALDLIIMSSNEVGEVMEPFVPHRGASSTMPQKRNPISSELILAASKLLRANAGLGLDSMVADFERASGPWHLEWVAVPESFVLAVGALHQAEFVFSGMTVDQERLLHNLNSTDGLIVAEAVMMGLAPHLGRQNSHDIIYEACKTAIETKTTLYEVLKRNSEVVTLLGDEKLQEMCDPKNYLGASTQMVDTVTALSRSLGV